MVSRLDAEGLGVELVRLYGSLETELAAGVARRVAAGIDSPGWLNAKLAQSGEVRQWAETLTRRIAIGSSVRRAVVKAFDAGAESAQRSLAGPLAHRRDLTPVQRTLPGAQAIDRLAAGLAGRLDSAGLRVARSVTDAYQQTVTAGAASILGGAQTRRVAASSVWNRLLDKGFTGFTDVRGRNWSLAGYVDMATRTTTAQAAVAGQLDRQAQYGLDLVIVSNAPQECVRCRPWEGKILTRDGSGAGGKTLRVQHATEDRDIEVRVAGSVAEATAAGLLHPNCRHSLSAYLPGLTVAPATGSTADPEGNAARERLRQLERQVRSAKLQEAGALTPEARAAAVQRQKVAQAKIRQHVKDTKHLGIKRKPEREQLDLGNRRNSAAPPPPPAPRPAPAPAPVPPRPTPAPEPRPAPAPVPSPTPRAPAVDLSGVEISVRTAAQRQIVEEQLQIHAGLAPRTMRRLTAVRSASDAELRAVGPTTIAFYRIAQRALYLGEDPFNEAAAVVGRRCSASGWWTRCAEGAHGGVQSLAHEVGHHIDLCGMSEWWKSARIVEMWQTLAAEAGLPAFETEMYGQVHVLLGHTTWMEVHAKALAAAVSTYGATDKAELLAEIWAEYSSLGDKARPLIRKIGKMMQEIAEMEKS